MARCQAVLFVNRLVNEFGERRSGIFFNFNLVQWQFRNFSNFQWQFRKYRFGFGKFNSHILIRLSNHQHSINLSLPLSLLNVSFQPNLTNPSWSQSGYLALAAVAPSRQNYMPKS